MTVRIEKPEFNLRSKLNDLDFGVVPLQKIPPGSIVNVTEATSSTQLLTTTAQDYVDFMTGYTTVKQTGSKFLVILDAQGYYSNSPNGVNTGIKRGVDNAYITLNNLATNDFQEDQWMGLGHGSSNVSAASWSRTRIVLDPYPNYKAGDYISYVGCAGQWAGGNLYVNYAGYESKSTLTMVEIKQ